MKKIVFTADNGNKKYQDVVSKSLTIGRRVSINQFWGKCGNISSEVAQM
ncbi:MAG: hypothetical protein ABI091_07115 [Ferruginibacter sp.]